MASRLRATPNKSTESHFLYRDSEQQQKMWYKEDRSIQAWKEKIKETSFFALFDRKKMSIPGIKDFH